jgi:cellulose synthase/poly-beta-1,6-N-acetylglucosamine synthase-like glycosyltransferase
MSVSIFLLHAVYIICMFGLALYGFQALWLTWYYRQRNRGLPDKAQTMTAWPTVAVHLPIYNERHVAERIIRACTRLIYPAGKLEILVLDDSDDATSGLIHRSVQEACEQGHHVRVLHRSDRSGYKAGALSHALRAEDAEFIAIFDADFEPPEDFLLRTMPRFYDPGNERVGFVQTRWGHLNRNNSFLTRCQALALDGHFVVEQGGRQAANFAFGFNGSGGVWRRACIQDPEVGGWQADTLCEDLDLSYRAQLAGWKGAYLNDVESPAEIPPQLLAFKRQQFRWAKGSVQTLRKLLFQVWNSDWQLSKRIAATLHLGSYLIHPLLLGLLLITLPLTLTGADPAAPLALLSITSFGPPILYAAGQRHLHGRSGMRNLILLPLLMLLGTGLSLSNSFAAFQGLFGHNSDFLRTPKFHATTEADQWQASTYRLPLQPIVYAELLMAWYALATVAVCVSKGNYWTSAFVMIYASGFGLVACLGLWQAWKARSSISRHEKQRIYERRSLA